MADKLEQQLDEPLLAPAAVREKEKKSTAVQAASALAWAMSSFGMLRVGAWIFYIVYTAFDELFKAPQAVSYIFGITLGLLGYTVNALYIGYLSLLGIKEYPKFWMEASLTRAFFWRMLINVPSLVWSLFPASAFVAATGSGLDATAEKFRGIANATSNAGWNKAADAISNPVFVSVSDWDVLLMNIPVYHAMIYGSVGFLRARGQEFSAWYSQKGTYTRSQQAKILFRQFCLLLSTALVLYGARNLFVLTNDWLHNLDEKWPGLSGAGHAGEVAYDVLMFSGVCTLLGNIAYTYTAQLYDQAVGERQPDTSFLPAGKRAMVSTKCAFMVGSVVALTNVGAAYFAFGANYWMLTLAFYCAFILESAGVKLVTGMLFNPSSSTVTSVQAGDYDGDRFPAP